VNTPPVTPARWDALRRFTDARIALGRAGCSLPTGAHLGFQLAHAQARDAVHLPFDAHDVAVGLQGLGLRTLMLHSAAADRATYLQRPDLGRRLDDRSRQMLVDLRSSTRFDVAFVVADGLSALAVHRNAVELVAAALKRLRADSTQTWTVAPVAVVEQGRVAVGDETGEGLQANVVVVLIGERPGLSSPDSLGLYITWAPKAGLTDANRNCISNVRAAGLSIDAAAAKLHQLLSQSRLRQLTGVGLKDDTDDLAAAVEVNAADNFLLAPPGS
jgi:ethanolamine ammonia-lyase small subunit